MDSRFTASEALAAARAAADGVYGVVFNRGTIEIGYYAPVGKDVQEPHAQDEIYVVHSGCGLFELDGDVRPCSAGDVLFVPANVSHRFRDVSDKFGAWVIFVGAAGREPDR